MTDDKTQAEIELEDHIRSIRQIGESAHGLEETGNPSANAVTAVLLDIDGTLVDSNYLHVDAWARAFAELGRDVDSWRIHRSIGMDSGALVDGLLGEEAADLGEVAKQLHSRFYLRDVDRLRSLPGAGDLLSELSRRGYRVVLATSAPENELEILLGVLGVEGSVDAVTSSTDVHTAKPDPEVIHTALDKAGVAPEGAIMVGDSVWDVIAARRAGVDAIGVLSGGVGREELLEAGALAVYDDVAELLRELDRSPIARTAGE